MDRRAFLRRTAAAGFLFGGGELFADGAPEPPRWLSDARSWMLKKDFRGIVIVVPDSAPERAALGRALWQRLTQGGAPVHALFLQSIFVFVREPVAQNHLGKDLKAWDLLVLSPDGSRILRDRCSPKSFQDPEAFVSCMMPAVFGDMREILTDRDEKALALAPGEARWAFAQLDHEDIGVRNRALDLLKKHLPDILPCLIRRALETTKANESEALRGILEAHYQKMLGWCLDPYSPAYEPRWREMPGEGPFRQLPYGVTLSGEVYGGCGVAVEEPPEGESLSKADLERISRSSVMLCGMASMRQMSHSFLKFLAE